MNQRDVDSLMERTAVDFPMLAVRHLADKPCRCQTCARHIEQNIHWPTCIVGQAQEFLGRTVKFCDPDARTDGDK